MPSDSTNPNRRRFLAISLSLAAIPFFPTAFISEFSKSGNGMNTPFFAKPDGGTVASLFANFHNFIMKRYLDSRHWCRYVSVYVSGLGRQIQKHVRPEDHARVWFAAMKIDALYDFIWVLPMRTPNFATVLTYLETGEIPAHLRELEWWETTDTPEQQKTAQQQRFCQSQFCPKGTTHPSGQGPTSTRYTGLPSRCLSGWPSG